MSSEIKLADVGDEQSVRHLLRGLTGHPAYRVAMQPFDFVSGSLSSSWRLATQAFRHLPTAVIVAAQKPGTADLYAHLIKHPRCLEAAEQEVNYFSRYPHRSVRWYRSRFPLRRSVLRRSGQVLEASSSYLAEPAALRRMQKVLPNPRVIVLLSDPVSRAFSSYQHMKTRHLESRSLADAVEDDIRAAAFPAQWGVALRENAQPMLGYVSGGYYALQLELLLKLYRRNRVLVIDSANLFADTGAVCERVFSYMGLESIDVEPTKMYDLGYDVETINPRVADRLRDHYRPYDEMLKELLGHSFGWMTPPARSQAA